MYHLTLFALSYDVREHGLLVTAFVVIVFPHELIFGTISPVVWCDYNTNLILNKVLKVLLWHLENSFLCVQVNNSNHSTGEKGRLTKQD